MKKKKAKSFAGQLKKAFILVVLLPVLVIGGFWLVTAHTYFERQSTSESMNLIELHYNDITSKMEACERSVRYLSSSHNLQEFLILDEEDYLTISRYSNGIGELFYNAMMTNRYFRSVEVFSDKEFKVLVNFIKNNGQVKTEGWYRNLETSQKLIWWREKDKIYLGCPIVSAYPNKVIGVLRMEVKEQIFTGSQELLQHLPFAMSIDKTGSRIYDYTADTYTGHDKIDLEKIEAQDHMEIRYRIDQSYFTDYTLINYLPMLGLILLVIALSWVLIYYYFRKLTSGMKTLVHQVKEAQSGNLDVEITGSDIIELHILAESVESFIHRIKQLIHQVYAKEIERKELELDLLQSKISPHFLYNNLSSINWLALECGQEQICRITNELATFYRTALNKGKNHDQLFIEVENIKAYLELQLMAHEDSFDVVYEIDKDLLDHDVPIFVLQPLVENSIYHGLHYLRDERGRIEIVIRKKGQEIEMLVKDNGKSLYQKIGDNCMRVSDYGYGTSNVHRRIQLLYGKTYGLTVAACKEGTTAQITIPWICFQK